MNVPYRFGWLLTFLIVALISDGAAQTAARVPASDATAVGQWMLKLSFRDRALSSYGAIKIHPDTAAIGADGRAYVRVSPYGANLGISNLLRARFPDALPVAEGWIDWYFAHLTPQSAPDGVPDEHFYLPDGSGETTCLKPGDDKLCSYNDATDSAAATFFSVLWDYSQAGGNAAFLRTPERKAQIEKLADVLLALQNADGLCWAKSDYRAKYLEDNCEVFAGLRDLAKLQREIFADSKRAATYERAAERVQQGILRELYDAPNRRYYPAKMEDGSRPAVNLDRWYADTQCQMWPHLFGVVAATDPKTQHVVADVNARWNGRDKPDWAANPEAVNGGWINADVAHAIQLSGDTRRVPIYWDAVRRLKFSDDVEQKWAWPFSVADAGWLLALATSTTPKQLDRP